MGKSNAGGLCYTAHEVISLKTIDELNQCFAEDHFARRQGIEIAKVSAEGAVCTLLLGDGHRNAFGGAQGGLLYTLADFAFAVAANSERLATATLDSTIHFLRPVAQGKLTARAKLKNRSRAICVYTVDIMAEDGALVATATMTGYTKADIQE